MPKEEKRRPTLADRFLSFAPTISRLYGVNSFKQVVQGVRQARKFVFDDEATLRLADVVMKVPQLVAREHQFARAPFDVMWIEYPAFLYWKAFRDADPERYDRAGKWGDTLTADRNLGFLIDHDRVNIIVDSNDGREPLLCVHQYRMNTEWPLQDQIKFAEQCGTSRMMLDFMFWGQTWDQLDEAERRTLRGYNMIEWMPSPDHWQKKIEAGLGPDIMRGSAGEFRTLIAMLLMMNRPSLTKYQQVVPHGRGWIKGKVRPFMSYTTVNISIDPIPTLQLVGTALGEGIERRRHEVRGHYCHDQTARDYMRIAGCIHDWKACDDEWTPLENPDEVGDHHHWMCSQCGGKRWWRNAFERGNAALGFVHHNDYRVSG